MRLTRLDLLKYGKFSDRVIDLPHATHDFHLIVGPNEAGKSTLRSAILDLFYGIGKISPFAFQHAYSEMKIGARIEHDGKSLEFLRTKGLRKTLTTPADTVLSDDALVPFLGATDRAFFDQMFGLDHDKLVRGGNEILNASNDIGQILFQSASGIGNLGEVRKTLEAEANALWAPKKSADREYYIARDELEKAEALLKSAIVRTKEWVEYRSNVDRLELELAAARDKMQVLEVERMRLERIRRVAPALSTWRQKQAELSALGAVIALPPNATTVLADAELKLAVDGQAHHLFESQLQALRTQHEALAVNHALLQRQTDIEALADTRQQVRHHENDIIKRQHEINLQWRAAQSLSKQLGWEIDTEDALLARLPPALTCTAITSLIKRRVAIDQALATAEETLNARRSDLKAIDAQANAIADLSVPPALRSALDAARQLGEPGSAERLLRNQVRKATADSDAARHGLGNWALDVASLRTMNLPAAAEIDSLVTRKTRTDSEIEQWTLRIEDSRAAVRSLELDIAQFRATHNAVTKEELTAARAQRDALWNAIKDGRSDVATSAPDYESKVSTADQLSDQRHDRAQQASELQGKLDALEVLRMKLAEAEARLASVVGDQTLAQEKWDALSTATGLHGMPLLAMTAWTEARKRVLDVSDALTEAQAALDDLLLRATQATSTLAAALGKPATADASLPTLIVEAAELIDAASLARIRKEELLKQRQHAESAITILTTKFDDAKRAVGDWDASWQKQLTAIGLPTSTDIATAESALALFSQMQDALRTIDDLRRNRIDAMRADLDDFERQALALIADVEQDLAGQTATVIASELSARLAIATKQDTESKRLSAEIAAMKSKCDDADARLLATRASTQPLLHLAQAANHDELRRAIDRSDKWRALEHDVAAAHALINSSGDSLSIEELEAESGAADIGSIPIQLGEIDRQRNEMLDRLSVLSVDFATAQTALSKIAGNDDAARAESQRQQALSRMANAAERYTKVRTAARLLQWAIDRYRQTRQGPMLEAASTIFAALTLGNFKKLIVDFDSHPLALEAQREDQKMVGIPGLSDGTRDQLYLALRLAALELHLEQTQSLPFLADDLFINFDDARSKAGLEALAKLSTKTQVLFLSHHDHLVPTVQQVFGSAINIVYL